MRLEWPFDFAPLRSGRTERDRGQTEQERRGGEEAYRRPFGIKKEPDLAAGLFMGITATAASLRSRPFFPALLHGQGNVVEREVSVA